MRVVAVLFYGYSPKNINRDRSIKIGTKTPIEDRVFDRWKEMIGQGKTRVGITKEPVVTVFPVKNEYARDCSVFPDFRDVLRRERVKRTPDRRSLRRGLLQ